MMSRVDTNTACLLLLFSTVSIVCCEVPQLTIDQNKDNFCPGETVRLICTWKDPRMPALTWTVNGTKNTLKELNNIPGHSVNSSILGGYTIVSITQTQPSTTTYTCVTSDIVGVPSQSINVKIKDSPLELSISCMNEVTSLLVLLNVTSEGCPPLEQVRIKVNDTFIIGRYNDTFRFDEVSPGESYTVRVETQVKGEGFSLYEEIPAHVYSTPEVLMTTDKTMNKQSFPVVPVAVAVAIVLVVLLVTAAVTCGVIIVLRSRHSRDRKIGVRDVILCPDAFQHTANKQKVFPGSTARTESPTGKPMFGNGSPIMTVEDTVEGIEPHGDSESRDMSNQLPIECPPNAVNNYSSSSENSSPRSTDGLLGHYAEIDHNCPHPIVPPPVDNKVVYAKV